MKAGIVLLLGLSMFPMVGGRAEGRGDVGKAWPTPEITRIEAFDVSGTVTYAMRGELGDSGEYVGLAIVCRTDALEVTGFFGSFPGVHHPVQFSVRGANGNVERFGPVVAAGPESGFHSPRLTAFDEVARFVRIALQPGSLVSNGYRSFWNRVSEARNGEVREAFIACVRGKRR